jgi:tight adherence protein B
LGWLEAPPLIYIAWRKRRRLRSFDQQLPELLDMIKSSLEAGHTLQRSLQVSVQEFSDPASSEFRIVLEQNRLGVPLARALEYLLERIPDENLRFLVVAVKIQTDVGSSLAGIISQLAKTVRDRQRMEMKIRVLTAQPRISALVGGLMPILLLLALSVLNPDAVQMLFHDPAGIKLTKVAAALEVMAFLTISRMVRMDY